VDLSTSVVRKFAKSTFAVETGFLVAGVTVAMVAAIQSVLAVAGWLFG
jgi:Flp pilus assembly pilin Flp